MPLLDGTANELPVAGRFFLAWRYGESDERLAGTVREARLPPILCASCLRVATAGEYMTFGVEAVGWVCMIPRRERVPERFPVLLLLRTRCRKHLFRSVEAVGRRAGSSDSLPVGKRVCRDIAGRMRSMALKRRNHRASGAVGGGVAGRVTPGCGSPSISSRGRRLLAKPSCRLRKLRQICSCQALRRAGA